MPAALNRRFYARLYARQAFGFAYFMRSASVLKKRFMQNRRAVKA